MKPMGGGQRARLLDHRVGHPRRARNELFAHRIMTTEVYLRDGPPKCGGTRVGQRPGGKIEDPSIRISPRSGSRRAGEIGQRRLAARLRDSASEFTLRILPGKRRDGPDGDQ